MARKSVINKLVDSLGVDKKEAQELIYLWRMSRGIDVEVDAIISDIKKISHEMLEDPNIEKSPWRLNDSCKEMRDSYLSYRYVKENFVRDDGDDGSDFPFDPREKALDNAIFKSAQKELQNIMESGIDEYRAFVERHEGFSFSSCAHFDIEEDVLDLITAEGNIHDFEIFTNKLKEEFKPYREQVFKCLQDYAKTDVIEQFNMYSVFNGVATINKNKHLTEDRKDKLVEIFVKASIQPESNIDEYITDLVGECSYIDPNIAADYFIKAENFDGRLMYTSSIEFDQRTRIQDVRYELEGMKSAGEKITPEKINKVLSQHGFGSGKRYSIKGQGKDSRLIQKYTYIKHPDIYSKPEMHSHLTQEKKDIAAVQRLIDEANEKNVGKLHDIVINSIKNRGFQDFEIVKTGIDEYDDRKSVYLAMKEGLEKEMEGVIIRLCQSEYDNLYGEIYREVDEADDTERSEIPITADLEKIEEDRSCNYLLSLDEALSDMVEEFENGEFESNDEKNIDNDSHDEI